jgi:hypothetical protein
MLGYYKKGGFGRNAMYTGMEKPWMSYDSQSGGINIDRAVTIANTLPIIFIPSFTKKKLEALGHDYKKVFKDLGYYRISGVNYRWDDNGIDYKKSIKHFNSLVSIDESILISVLNNRMGRGLNGHVQETSPVQDYITFNLSENDYLATLANKLIPALSQSTSVDENPYTIEKDNECIYIIMNTNSFYDFDNTYKVLSRELCEMLLGLVDDSFVFQSAFFRCL